MRCNSFYFKIQIKQLELLKSLSNASIKNSGCKLTAICSNRGYLCKDYPFSLWNSAYWKDLAELWSWIWTFDSIGTTKLLIIQNRAWFEKIILCGQAELVFGVQIRSAGAVVCRGPCGRSLCTYNLCSPCPVYVAMLAFKLTWG